MWVRSVSRLIYSLSGISLLLSPSASAYRTSRSRVVSFSIFARASLSCSRVCPDNQDRERRTHLNPPPVIHLMRTAYSLIYAHSFRAKEHSCSYPYYNSIRPRLW